MFVARFVQISGGFSVPAIQAPHASQSYSARQRPNIPDRDIAAASEFLSGRPCANRLWLRGKVLGEVASVCRSSASQCEIDQTPMLLSEDVFEQQHNRHSTCPSRRLRFSPWSRKAFSRRVFVLDQLKCCEDFFVA